MLPRVFLGLGSNIGERERHLDAALLALGERGLTVVRASGRYLTEPVDAPPQDWFLNQAVEVQTSLGPEGVLEAVLAIEKEEGRVRTVARGPRTLDVDLLLHGEAILDTPRLTLPHPRLQERRFVLVPLAEIAAEIRHPRLGLTVAELLLRCPDRSAVVPVQAVRAR